MDDLSDQSRQNKQQDKIDELRAKISKRDLSDLEYMSDRVNWVCAHVTKYLPKQNSEGEIYIPTTSMVTDFESPRATVHTTINQIVGNNVGGNWDNALNVVLAPYIDIVNKNGNPQEVSVADTYFIPNPDTGLILPKSAFIIQPDDNSGDLYTIGENGATYKTDKYTQKEIDKILSFSSVSKAQYDEYMNGDIPDYMVKDVLGYDEKLIRAYEKSKDRKAFMRGILEEDRFVILNKLLRDEVIKKSLEKMGYRYVFAHEDEISNRVAEVALQAGIRGDGGNKGHSLSLEGAMEDRGDSLLRLKETLESKNLEEICDALLNPYQPMGKEVINSILEGAPVPNIYKVYVDTLNQHIIDNEFYAEHENDPKHKKELLDYANKLKEGGINGYSPFLDTSLHRNADKITDMLNSAINEIRKDPKICEQIKTTLKAKEVQNALLAKENSCKR